MTEVQAVPPPADHGASTAMCECGHHWSVHAESNLTARTAICHGYTGSATPGPLREPCRCTGFAQWTGPRDSRTGEPVKPLALTIDARVTDDQAVPPPRGWVSHIQPRTGRECPYEAAGGVCNKCGWAGGHAVPPPADAAIAGMIATRYSGQPTQRDLDVAKVAAAADRAARARLAERANALWQRAKTCNAEASQMPDSEFKQWLKAWMADALDLLWEVGGRDADLLDGQL